MSQESESVATGPLTALTMRNVMSVREAEQAVYDTVRGQYWNHLASEQSRHVAWYRMDELGRRGFAW